MTVIDTPSETTVIQRQHDTPMGMIERAHAMKADPAQVEKWMELQERYERREAEKAYASAMHLCQQAMPPIHKAATNSHTRSNYATLEDVQRHARPVYSEYGFSLSFGEAPCDTEGYKRTVCDVVHVQGHTKRYHLDLPIDGEGSQGGKSAMNRVQGCISTTSYGQRRLLCMIFNITLTDEDDDGQGANIQLVTEEQAIQLGEAAQDVPKSIVTMGFKWVGRMTGVTPKDFNGVPAIAFDAFRGKLLEKANEARKGE